MKTENIQNIYQLSPLQQGILFHSLHSPSSAVYFVQLCYILRGNINVDAFEKSWQQVVDRHTALRTGFYWENIEKPHQIVYRKVQVFLEQHDWRSISPSVQRQELDHFLLSERNKGFNFSQAPLMRLNLVRVADNCYYFVWNKHHLILDGWSTALVLKEVVEVYEAFCQGQNVPLATTSYGDYINWLQQQDLSKAEFFWRRVLKGIKAPTSLTSLQVHRKSLEEEKHNQQTIKISKLTTDSLQYAARKYGLTLNTLVQGAWAIFLSRYSGEEDVIYGVTVSGRPVELPKVESTVGMFINTLPLRVKLAGEDFLVPWLQQLQAQLIEMRQYEYSPLVEIQGWSEILRGLPLFENILVFENYPIDEDLKTWQSNLEIENVINFEKTNYPLTVTVIPGSELSITIDYSSRFDTDTINRMLGHLQTLLEGILSNPQQRLSELPLLTESEQHKLLQEWNDTKVDYADKKCIHELFEAQVERTPLSVAVVFEDQKLTYRELNAKANQLAHHLCSLGVKPEVLVGICVERSLDMVIGLLAILKAGGAYVPLDPNYPQERIALMLNNAQVPVLLTKQHLLAQLPAHRAKVICLDNDVNWQAANKQNPINQTTPANLAYVIYTSGSTGTPKGVTIQHQSLVNFVQAAINEYQLQAEDRILQFASFSFDAAYEEIFPCLLHGATLVLRSDEMLASIPAFNEKCHQYYISVLDIPTAFWHQLTSELSTSQFKLPESLRLVIIGGEKASPDKVSIWRQQVESNIRLINSYGPTETTVVATICDLTTPFEEVAIGTAIANVQTYVLDDSYLQPVPIGVWGELYIGGDGVARGYLHQPQLTADSFIPNPFSNEPGSRLYKTGDQVRYRSDGKIEFNGRVDNQVKIRGFRIELGDIEAVLCQHPAVRETAVIVCEESLNIQRIVAYVVAKKEQTLTTTELRSFLQSKLPNYMVPSSFVTLEALPLTPNGKVDRKALPVPDQVRPELEAVYLPPQTEVEKTIANIWQEVLRIEEIGIHDNFFELGGHSLLLIQLHSKLQKIFKELSLVDIFQYPTINYLAKYLTQSQDKGQSVQENTRQNKTRTASINRRKQARQSYRTAKQK